MLKNVVDRVGACIDINGVPSNLSEELLKVISDQTGHKGKYFEDSSKIRFAIRTIGSGSCFKAIESLCEKHKLEHISKSFIDVSIPNNYFKIFKEHLEINSLFTEVYSLNNAIEGFSKLRIILDIKDHGETFVFLKELAAELNI